MTIRTCAEVGCDEPVERGHSRCPACREYITEIKQHEKEEREPVRLQQIGTNEWQDDAGWKYTKDDSEGEDSSLEFNDSDAYLDGRE